MPGPLTLVFETSSPTASLLLAGPDGVQVERAFTSDRSHNAVLFGPLSEVLAGISPQEIGLVLVGSGPGSYSGTRVGLAAAQGVALAAGCPVVAVPSVIAATSALAGSCLVLGDARRGSYWTAAVKAGQLEREPELADETGFRKLLESAGVLVSFEDAARTKFPTDRAISFEQPTRGPALASLVRDAPGTSGSLGKRAPTAALPASPAHHGVQADLASDEMSARSAATFMDGIP